MESERLQGRERETSLFRVERERERENECVVESLAFSLLFSSLTAFPLFLYSLSHSLTFPCSLASSLFILSQLFNHAHTSHENIHISIFSFLFQRGKEREDHASSRTDVIYGSINELFSRASLNVFLMKIREHL